MFLQDNKLSLYQYITMDRIVLMILVHYFDTILQLTLRIFREISCTKNIRIEFKCNERSLSIYLRFRSRTSIFHNFNKTSFTTMIPHQNLLLISLGFLPFRIAFQFLFFPICISSKREKNQRFLFHHITFLLTRQNYLQLFSYNPRI